MDVTFHYHLTLSYMVAISHFKDKSPVRQSTAPECVLVTVLAAITKCLIKTA